MHTGHVVSAVAGLLTAFLACIFIHLDNEDSTQHWITHITEAREKTKHSSCRVDPRTEQLVGLKTQSLSKLSLNDRTRKESVTNKIAR
jgi:hypothetical protein